MNSKEIDWTEDWEDVEELDNDKCLCIKDFGKRYTVGETFKYKSNTSIPGKFLYVVSTSTEQQIVLAKDKFNIHFAVINDTIESYYGNYDKED